MARCPKCNVQLHGICGHQTGSQRFFISKDGETHDESFEPDGDLEEYYCPGCDRVLATDMDAAVALINQE